MRGWQACGNESVIYSMAGLLKMLRLLLGILALVPSPPSQGRKLSLINSQLSLIEQQSIVWLWWLWSFTCFLLVLVPIYCSMQHIRGAVNFCMQKFLSIGRIGIFKWDMVRFSIRNRRWKAEKLYFLAKRSKFLYPWFWPSAQSLVFQTSYL